MGEHRAYLISLKSKHYLDFYNDFINEISKQIPGKYSFEDLFVNSESSIENKLWYSGLNKKTVGDIYGSQSQEMFEYAINQIGPNINEILSNIRINLNSIVFNFKGNKNFEINGHDFIKILLATSTKHAALKGGFASSFGKQIEKLLMLTICLIFDINKDNYYAFDIRDNDQLNRETDFFFIKNNQKYKCEIKMTGRGNPEGADSMYARDTAIFIGHTLSETNKIQCTKNGVYWVELRDMGWTKFKTIFDEIGIKSNFTHSKLENLDYYIEKASDILNRPE